MNSNNGYIILHSCITLRSDPILFEEKSSEDQVRNFCFRQASIEKAHLYIVYKTPFIFNSKIYTKFCKSN